MLQKDTISIIIAIYNVERYIRRCIQSVLDQTYSKLQIILVDDGSTDSCPLICDEFAKLDNRVVVIHQKNRGLSGARNSGVDNATGEYIAFIDGDDFVCADMYERLLCGMHAYDCDVIQTGYTHVREDGSIRKIRQFSNATYPTFDAMMDGYFRQGNIHVGAWSKLYRREVFSSIRFVEGLVIEDFEILIKVFAECQKFVVTDTALYNYVLTDNSISRKPMNHIMARSRIEIPRIVYENVKRIDSKYLPYLDEYVCRSAVVGYCGVSLSNEFTKTEKRSLKSELHKQYRKHYSAFRRSLRSKRIHLAFLAFMCLPELWVYAEWLKHKKTTIKRVLTRRSFFASPTAL